MFSQLHCIDMKSSPPNKKRPMMKLPCTNKKRKKMLVSTFSGAQSSVNIKGVECPNNIYVCWIGFHTVNNVEIAYYIHPFQNALNAWKDNREHPLYGENTRNLGSEFRIDNSYNRAASNSHTDYRPQRPNNQFHWTCFVWTKPDDPDDPDFDWSLQHWLENFRTQFVRFVNWTSLHRTVYDYWKFANPNVNIEQVSDQTLRGSHPLAYELVDNDVLHVICNSHDYINNINELMENRDLVIRYFGDDGEDVQRRLMDAIFPNL